VQKFEVTFMEEPKHPEIKPLPEKKVEVKPTPVELVAPPPIVVPEAPPVMIAPVAPPVESAPAPTPITLASGNGNTPPKLILGTKPDYPAAAVRAGEEGTTHIEVCVASNGRVTSATVSSSSGSPRLDEAAVKWVRGERFKPGMVDGQAQSMCSHDVAYLWSLKDARS
jgi:protein TonB